MNLFKQNTYFLRSKIETKNRSNVLIRKLLWFRNQISEKPIEIEDEDMESDVNQAKDNTVDKTKSFFNTEEIHELINM